MAWPTMTLASVSSPWADQCRQTLVNWMASNCSSLLTRLTVQVDRKTGALSDTRTRFLGTRPAILVPVSVAGRRSMLALSSRPWLGYRWARLRFWPPCAHRVSQLGVQGSGQAQAVPGQLLAVSLQRPGSGVWIPGYGLCNQNRVGYLCDGARVQSRP